MLGANIHLPATFFAVHQGYMVLTRTRIGRYLLVVSIYGFKSTIYLLNPAAGWINHTSSLVKIHQF
jgi:hypothetical protein